MKEVVEAKTRWELNRKIRKKREKHPGLEILEKGPSRCGCTKQKFYFAVVSYEEKGDLLC